jgi:hypothetical protein
MWDKPLSHRGQNCSAFFFLVNRCCIPMLHPVNSQYSALLWNAERSITAKSFRRLT